MPPNVPMNSSRLALMSTILTLTTSWPRTRQLSNPCWQRIASSRTTSRALMRSRRPTSWTSATCRSVRPRWPASTSRMPTASGPSSRSTCAVSKSLPIANTSAAWERLRLGRVPRRSNRETNSRRALRTSTMRNRLLSHQNEECRLNHSGAHAQVLCALILLGLHMINIGWIGVAHYSLSLC